MPENFIIFDTEYTAWEGAMERQWSGENEYKEVVQIGAIKVTRFQEIDSFLCYIRPRINPHLSNYFKNLTGITQEDVDTKGLSFVEGLAAFYNWTDSLPLYSYGPDVAVLQENVVLEQHTFPFDERHFHDVREIFKKHGIDTSKYMSSTIPKAFDLAPPAAAHNALNDARSILLALQQLGAPSVENL